MFPITGNILWMRMSFSLRGYAHPAVSFRFFVPSEFSEGENNRKTSCVETHNKGRQPETKPRQSLKTFHHRM